MSAGYRLAAAARTDLVGIYRYTREQFGSAQADAYIETLKSAFALIGAQPNIGAERTDITPPVRLHPHGRHNILYIIDLDGPLILRVLSGRQRWQLLLFDQA